VAYGMAMVWRGNKAGHWSHERVGCLTRFLRVVFVKSHTVVGVQGRVRRVAFWDTPRCQNIEDLCIDLGL
jgi:hypothetical protein